MSAIGDVYTGAWICTTSANSSGSQYTEPLSLPKGAYVVVVSTPVFEGTTQITVSGTSSYPILEQQQQAVYVMTLSAASTIYVSQSSSVSKTFSYKERGGIVAIRVS